MIDGFRGNVVATAKRNLKVGKMLDIEVVFTVCGKFYTAKMFLCLGGLLINLTHHVKLKTNISVRQPVRWQDVDVDETLEAIKNR